MNFQFCKMRSLQRKIQRKYQVENCPPLPGQNLISTCNRRVKSVAAGRVEISSWQAGMM